MQALKRLQTEKPCENTSIRDNRREKENKKWEEWAKWLKERQDAIDNAKTTDQKRAVAARYQRSHIGNI